MELEITPEPTPEERRAIELALAAESKTDPAGAGHSAWQEQGVLENTAPDEAD